MTPLTPQAPLKLHWLPRPGPAPMPYADEADPEPDHSKEQWVRDLGVWGLGFRVWGLGFRVWGLGFWAWGFGFGV